MKKVSQLGQRKDLKAALVLLIWHMCLLYTNFCTVFSEFFTFVLQVLIMYLSSISIWRSKKLRNTNSSTSGGRSFELRENDWDCSHTSCYWNNWKFWMFPLPIFGFLASGEQGHRRDLSYNYIIAVCSFQTQGGWLCNFLGVVLVKLSFYTLWYNFDWNSKHS